MREGTDARPATTVGPDEPPRCAHNPCPGRSLVLGQRDDPGSGGFRAVDAGQLRERNAPAVFRCGPHRPVQAGVGACRAMRCDSSAAGPRWSSRKPFASGPCGRDSSHFTPAGWRDHRRVRVRLFLRVPLSHGCLPANSRPGRARGRPCGARGPTVSSGAVGRQPSAAPCGSSEGCVHAPESFAAHQQIHGARVGQSGYHAPARPPQASSDRRRDSAGRRAVSGSGVRAPHGGRERGPESSAELSGPRRIAYPGRLIIYAMRESTITFVAGHGGDVDVFPAAGPPDRFRSGTFVTSSADGHRRHAPWRPTPRARDR